MSGSLVLKWALLFNVFQVKFTFKKISWWHRLSSLCFF